MKCPHCGQTNEAGATFCGNCGQPLAQMAPAQSSPAPAGPSVVQAAPTQPQVMQPTMAPAANAGPVVMAQPNDKSSENKAMASIILGAVAIPAALFPLLSLILGITGFVFGMKSRKSLKHRMSLVGIVLSAIAVVAALGMWGYTIAHDPRLKNLSGTAASTSLDTSCYNTKVSGKLKIDNVAGSCQLDAYDGSTIDSSTDAYSISSTSDSDVSATNLADKSKSVLDAVVKLYSTSSRTYSVSSQQSGTFAGDPAYYATITAHDNDLNQDASGQLAFVLHSATNGDNLFTFFHVQTGGQADLSKLAANFSWK